MQLHTPLRPLDHWRTQLEQGRCTARDLAEAALAAAAQAPDGAAAFAVRHDATARATAAALDARHRAGVPWAALGPLAGLPITVKDLLDEAGQVTRAGSRVLDDAEPAAADAPVVARLRAAGAVIVGRTTMTEFAFSGLGLNPHFGTPRNPWGRDEDGGAGRIPGGSSSGAAVSVTDGMAVAAIGSDTGGSVRIPAALCGLTGYKPTARRVPTDGCLPLSTTLDSIGPLAPSVACCARLDAVMAGEPVQPLVVRPAEGLVLAQPRTLVFDEVDAAVAAAWTRARQSLQGAGVRVVEIDVPEFAALAHLNRHGGFAAAEAWAWHAPLVARRAAGYDPRVLARVRRGEGFSAADYLDLQKARRSWIEAVVRRLQAVHAAAFLMPTVPTVAPRMGPLRDDDALFAATNLRMLRNPSLFNFLDGCALSLPIHAPGEAPVGLMLAAPAGHDAHLLSFGAGVEAALSAVRSGGRG